MKNILLILFVLGSIGYLATTQRWEPNATGTGTGAGRSGPDFSDPVYAVVRFQAEIHDRSFQAMALAKAADDADCKHVAEHLVETMGNDPKSAVQWSLQSSECTKNLEPRNLKLFSNRPINVSYVSAARGSSSERELRIVFWGVTVDESDRICETIHSVQRNWQGAVTCVHANRSQ